MTSERTADADAATVLREFDRLLDDSRRLPVDERKGGIAAHSRGVTAFDRLVARNQQLQEALAALLEWAEKDKGGYQFSDPSEEWYAIRDYVRAALSAGSGGREPTP